MHLCIQKNHTTLEIQKCKVLLGCLCLRMPAVKKEKKKKKACDNGVAQILSQIAFVSRAY